ncbi:MAG: hypothetical protein E6772_07745 [Dysgonomonas sp.]|nr:hypothetical protein [Dysgonomonas sp.]
MRKYILTTLFILMVLLLLFSCKTRTIHVPIESVRVEYRDKWLRDSVYLHDSILIKMQGDTVWLEKYKYLYRDKLVRDSVFITDTIQVAYPVKGDTEYINRLYWWQYLLMVLGAACTGIIVFKIYSYIKKHF